MNMTGIVSIRVPLVIAALMLTEACSSVPELPERSPILTVSETLTTARTHDGSYISWVEHLIDAEDINGGMPIRGGDGIVMVDLDGDGFTDVVTAQEDSNHLRVAYGSTNPDVWVLRTIAEGAIVAAVEDVAAGDLNGDGWPDLVTANEEAHLAYFQNPGPGARDEAWPSLILPFSEGRGSWLRVFIADINGDGKPDLTAANKGGADIIVREAGAPVSRPTSLITLHGPPLEPASWREQVLYMRDVPNTALPYDFNGDGRLDVLTAERLNQRMIILQNEGNAEDGSVVVSEWPIEIIAAFDAPEGWRGFGNAFQADVADLNGNGRPDIVVAINERVEGDPAGTYSGLGWIEQPASLDQPWRYHRIGTTLPDLTIGIHLADIDGDGDLDAITGGYSGLNVLSGTYSGAAREFDDPSVTAASTVGRITWYENPGDASGTWQRHDILRQVRGMYDMFLTRDMDGDGDLDIIAPRGNSGSFDGAFWLEQVRSVEPRPVFTPAREADSRHLPLPPDNWLELYDRAETLVAPNKAE